MCLLLHPFLLSAITVYFSQWTYRFTEGIRIIQPTIVLSNPSSTNITVQVNDTMTTATGESIGIIMKFLQHSCCI